MSKKKCVVCGSTDILKSIQYALEKSGTRKNGKSWSSIEMKSGYTCAKCWESHHD